MELGIYTFAETTPDPRTGRTVTPQQRLADLLEEIELPDERGQRAQLRRPRPRLSGLRHARPALGWARRDHGRPRLVHRELPALRLRPRRLRRAVLREARAAPRPARGRARPLGGPPPPGARRPGRL